MILTTGTSLLLLLTPIPLPAAPAEEGGGRRSCGSVYAPAPEGARDALELDRCLDQLRSSEKLIGAFSGYAALTLVLMGLASQLERRAARRARRRESADPASGSGGPATPSGAPAHDSDDLVEQEHDQEHHPHPAPHRAGSAVAENVGQQDERDEHEHPSCDLPRRKAPLRA